MATSSIFANFSINDKKTAEAFVKAIEQSEKEQNTVSISSIPVCLTDKNKIADSIFKTKFVITIEDGTLIGGLGTSVKDLILERKIQNVKVKNFGYPDKFIKHGFPKELEQLYQVDEESIISYIKYNIKKNEKKS